MRLLWAINQLASVGSENHPTPLSLSLAFFQNSSASAHNCLGKSNGPGATSQTRVLSQRKALSNVLRRKLDLLSSPAILKQEFIRVLAVCDRSCFLCLNRELSSLCRRPREHSLSLSFPPGKVAVCHGG